MVEDNKSSANGERRSIASAPSISLPKGGGAIRGIGEKFAANPVTGTGTMSVPIASSPGRSGFGPQLSLSYDSGAGNGPFGFGWALSLPQITRKTDRGLPRYDDAEESDVFILSGAEDLMPLLVEQNGTWVPETLPGRVIGTDSYTIRRYRPRIEGLFARIERWTRDADGDVHWRSVSKDNVLTLYGKSSNSRITDPADPRRVFTWLICETRDDKGNAVLYEYKAEDGAGVDLTNAHERNRGDRNDPRRATNRYLKRIRYGNRVPLLDSAGHRPRALTAAQIQNAGWMFEVVLDYGEHDADAPSPDDLAPWPNRVDPFSTYRAGFEVRTTRLCQRVLMFHHFAGEPGVGIDCLVRSTDFTYSHEQDPTAVRNPVYTFLLSVTQSGYKRNDGGYLKSSLPSVEYEYTQPIVQDTVHDVDASSLENLPIGVDGAAYQWTDLHGEGIPGILTEQAGAWFYKRNISPVSERPVEFAPLERVASRPNLAMAGGQAQFMDLAGDGQPDLAVLDGPTPGLYEHDDEEGWQPFRPFTSRLNRDTRDANMRFVDLDGDGHADVLISEDDAFVWHPSLAEEGFGPARRVAHALDEERGPRLVFADGTQSIHLADLSGDGLTDLVRIRSGDVCYWPNLGYGRFGAKVTMDRAPHLDNPDQFDHARIRLADIDGTGTTDIIYLHRDGVRLYFNQSGNSWSEPQPLSVFPRVDDLVSIVPTDLLGNGTACLVWSSPLPADAHHPMRYVDLMGGQKPHLLVRTVNNLGAETRVAYAPSTKFYLRDKLDGKPWITRLPFPVHVVERVETYDHVSRNRFVTRHAYHHGYFDGVERELRGFGMVEQFDTEEFASLSGSDDFPVGDNIDAASHVPPVHTKTWFHTGIFIDRNRISNFFAGLLNASDRGEYYREPGLDDAQARALLLDDTVLPEGLSAEEEREACRALKGAMLRQEVYALDGTAKAQHPYTVTEQNFTIRLLQARGRNPHAVFFSHPREATSYHYERNPTDPRTGHALTLEVDAFGNVRKALAIGYRRRQPDLGLPLQADRDKQAATLVTCTENDVTNPIDDPIVDPDNYRAPLPSASRSYELSGFAPAGGAARFSFNEWVADDFALLEDAVEISYEETADLGERQKRLIEHVRTLYRANELTGLLPPSTLQSLALPGESYKLAFTPGLARRTFVDSGKLTVAELDDALAGEGRYVHRDDDDPSWWIPSGRVFFSPGSADSPPVELALARQHFFLPRRYRDPFHTTAVSTESFVNYDAHDLLMVESRDALGNVVTVATADDAGNTAIRIDYRVLQPYWMTDPNGNRVAVAFDALGMVVGTAVMGKPPPALVEGDSLNDFVADLSEGVILDHLANPLDDPQAILGRATTRLVYDLFAYQRTKDQPEPQPAAVYTLARETHDSDPAPAGGLKIQHSFSYSDGFGREIQKKVRAEPGLVPLRDGDGRIVVGADGQPVMTPHDGPRWVGSGWTVFNNKGKPVRQYEPFFTESHRFDFDVRIGVSPVVFYDPVERVVATLHPNHSWEKVVFDPWRQEAWDVSDTILIADPTIDPDAGDFFRRLPDADYLPTWHTRRQGGALGPHEQAAARKSAIHAGTPSVTHADSLGRTFLTVAHNTFKFSGTPPADPPIEELYPTRVILDIEGNQREVIDAKDRIIMRYDYDMLGTRIHQASMEAGERRMLSDVAGNPIRAWDSRGHAFRNEYDPLHRPLRSFVRGTDPLHPAAVILFGKTEYGEGQPNAVQLNLRTRAFRQFDSAGVATGEGFDFKGNLLRSSRRLAADYKTTPNWSARPGLEQETFTSRTTYDALNRPVQLIAPRSDQPGTTRNVIQPAFNEANLLERLDVWLDRPTEPADLLDVAMVPPSPVGVNDIDYDAKGQRQRIAYKNGATTRYTYDPETFRLMHLYTRRGPTFTTDCENPDPPPPPTIAAPDVPPSDRRCGLQNLHYTYDPVGNITHIRDDAQQSIYFNNQVTTPDNDYTYDAIYRLINARGREHIGQVTKPETTWNDELRVNLQHPQDGLAMRNYTERYEYDAVGNFEHLIHRFGNSGWTRDYTYAEDSILDSTKRSNRLSTTTVGQTTDSYTHDAHGNVTFMRHLPVMRWDFRDQLVATARQVVNDGTPETTYYVYDGTGQRVRKVTEREGGGRKNERIYLGGFEEYREYDGTGAAVRLERETLHVMDDKQRIALVETKTLDVASPLTTHASLIRYQFGNHLGTASLELDDHAQVIAYEEYYAYGSTSYQAVDVSIKAAAKRHRYIGMERDDETGLSYHNARYYAPWLGRWASADPIGIQGDTNLYAYSSDRPIVFTDRSGKDKGEPWPMEKVKAKLKTKVIGGALVDEPIKQGEKDIGHVGLGEGNIKIDLIKGGIEANLGLLEIDLHPHLTDDISVIITGRAVKGKASLSRKGAEVDLTLYEAGVGAGIEDVGKAKVLFGLSIGGGFKDGKLKGKIAAGIGFEFELDLYGILRPIHIPVPVALSAPNINLNTEEEVTLKFSGVTHVEAPPPPKMIVKPRPKRHRPRVKQSEAFDYLGDHLTPSRSTKPERGGNRRFPNAQPVGAGDSV